MERINVTRSSMPSFEEYCEEIRDLWDSRWLTNMGAKHRELQQKLAQYLDIKCIDLLANGHMALELSLQALKLRGEVITTPFTFVSTTQAIVRNGLTPVFCDIDPATFTIDANKLEAMITERTSAIVPVHVYGNVCDVEQIAAIARKYHLRVIYDAAHGFGVRYKGRGIASYGDVSCFSFHATKVFHTIEGGAACFRDAEFGEQMTRLKNFGMSGPETVDAVGVNGKMSEFHAAMGLCNLRQINKEMKKRKEIAERYRSYLEGVDGIQLSPVQTDVETNYAYFPVLFHADRFGADRDQVAAALAEEGIMARKYFYPLTSSFACYQGRFSSEQTPVAQRVSRQVLCLPLYADLSLDDAGRICTIVLNCRRDI